ncbi:hypothetical protein CYMTET_16392 [Cymbomonas tetramitiformis]|uniref:Uncharacterized protein n=1 Tax=Cymbomonas tetramitiformis TaxID=36881 RepID=A0AAE0GC46_9CHLO|nr:hypothetical protein CYMTET_16392 [Cymbomonas tetramitiformis]
MAALEREHPDANADYEYLHKILNWTYRNLEQRLCVARIQTNWFRFKCKFIPKQSQSLIPKVDILDQREELYSQFGLKGEKALIAVFLPPLTTCTLKET